jgi:SAM-dependent methyltransferase
MFRVITKREYWEWRNSQSPRWAKLRRIKSTTFQRALAQYEGFLFPRDAMKTLQDHYVTHRFSEVRGAKIMEAGAGNGRLLERLSHDNECWAVDGYEGRGGGPHFQPHHKGVRVIKNYVGNFDPVIPSSYFDYAFSVSVVEHIHLAKLTDFAADCARVLKPGGRMIHLIDHYLFDLEDRDRPEARAWMERLAAYLALGDRPDLGMQFVEPPLVDPDLAFSCSFATQSDEAIYQIHRERPQPKREIAQVICLVAEWVKLA